MAGGGSGSGDMADARNTTLSVPQGIRLLANGDVLVADSFEHAIRRIDGATYAISTVAGQINMIGSTGDGGAATSAKLDQPCDIDIATNGDIYIYDGGNARIRVVSATTGNISTIVGTTTSACVNPSDVCGDGGAGTSASLKVPTVQGLRPSIRIAPNGDVWFSEPERQRIRKWTASTQTVQTIVGSGTSCGTFTSTCNDGGASSAAAFFSLGGIDFLGSGLIIADVRLRQTTDLTSSGTISNYAFTAGLPPSGDGGPATGAKAFAENSVRVVGNDVYFNSPDRVRRITGGTIETVVGLVGSVGDGPIAVSELANPKALTAIASDRWLIVDSDIGRLRTYDATAQTITTSAGYPFGFAAGTDPANRAFYAASLATPAGIAFDAAHELIYFSEATSHEIRTVTLSGDVKTWPLATISGSTTPLDGGYLDTDVADARYNRPSGLAYDAGRDVLWIADTGNHVLRRYDIRSGQVTTVAGSPHVDAFAGDGATAVTSFLNGPTAIALNPADQSLYIADTGNNRVRRLAPDGNGDISLDSVIDTVLGNGESSSSGDGTPARAVPALGPAGVAFDSHNNLWVTSTFTVRVLTPGTDGIVTGDDAVQTVYGTAPRITFPAEVSSCLSGLAVVSGDASVLVLDSCHGLMMRLDRIEAPTTEPH